MSWFVMRRELPTGKRAFLTICSFLFPLGLWALISMWLWRPDIKLDLPVKSSASPTMYTPGDRVDKFFIPLLQQQIRDDNASFTDEDSVSRRENRRRLRALAPLLITNGILNKDQDRDDAAIYDAHRDLNDGKIALTRRVLSPENLALVQANWQLMNHGPAYDYNQLTTRPLNKLLPQGQLSSPVFLPTPIDVWRVGLDDFTGHESSDGTTMSQRVLHSVKIIFLGFLCSVAIGVPLGIISGTWDFFARLIEPFVDFFRYMPAPAFATLLMASFGVDDGPKIALVFIGTFFQCVLMVSNTTSQLDASLLEAAQTLGANKRRLLSRVIFPGILPNLYNDLRILLGWSWTWLVIAELIGTKTGLTEFIDTQGRYRNFDRVFPVIIFIGVIGFATDQILANMRRFLFPWADEPPGPVAQAIWATITWLPRTMHAAGLERAQAIPADTRARSYGYDGDPSTLAGKSSQHEQKDIS